MKTARLDATTVLVRLLIVVLVAWPLWKAWQYGLQVRSGVYEWAHDIHFLGDMRNEKKWADLILDGPGAWEPLPNERRAKASNADIIRGVGQLYDVVERDAPDKEYQLDYVPGKALLMAFWWRDIYQHHPEASDFEHEYAAPMLQFNLVLEVIGCVGMFLLVRHWTNEVYSARVGLDPPAAAHSGWFLGLLAAALMWMNPAVLVEAHGWPQWDSWLVPFFIWAVYFACRDWYFAAGVSIALGAMLKGQILVVAPALILFPIFIGRPVGAIRFLGGFLLTVGVLMSPMLVRTHDAQLVVISALLAAFTGLAGAWIRPWYMRLLFAVIILALGVWPAVTTIGTFRPVDEKAQNVEIASILQSPKYGPGQKEAAQRLVDQQKAAIREAEVHIALFAALPALLVLAMISGSFSSVPFFATAVVMGSIFLAGVYFDGSFAWLEVGFLYGTRHYQMMTVGPSPNLALLMYNLWHYELGDVLFVSPEYYRIPPITFTVSLFLRTLYGISLVLCCIGAAMHFVRKDPRFLLAIITPWLTMFALLGQMHERYLLWFGAMAASLIAVDLGLAAVGVLMSLICSLQMLHQMISRSPSGVPDDVMSLVHYARRLEMLEIGLVLFSAALCLYLTVLPRQPRDDRGARRVGNRSPWFTGRWFRLRNDGAIPVESSQRKRWWRKNKVEPEPGPLPMAG